MAKIYNESALTPMKRVIMCPPTYHHFEPINVITEEWIAKGETADLAAYKREWEELVKAYEDNGIKVELMDPKPDLPYEVYSRDFGASVREGVVMGAFREPCRRGESAEYEAKLKELGVPIVARCTAGAFEGGDFWFLDPYTIAHGVVARTDWDGFTNVKRQLEEKGYMVYGVDCRRDNLHLDMCFNIVGDRIALCCTAAMPDNFLAMLEKRGFDLIDIPQEGVYRHHCNVQNIGDNKVVSFANNEYANSEMEKRGLKVIKPHLEQLLKGGGGPHCSTFPLERW
ncbi:MAG: dimethylarginine dimethylaminohydrolase family protein [Eggerthellaceae bacterium]|jgi:N-dimethylarginine dimethylaminohydrolase